MSDENSSGMFLLTSLQNDGYAESNRIMNEEGSDVETLQEEGKFVYDASSSSNDVVDNILDGSASAHAVNGASAKLSLRNDSSEA